jgi:hypothetical protein
VLVAAAAERPGDAEVGDEGVAVAGEEQVLGLDVAVDHALLVGVLEGLGRLARDPQRVFYGELALPPKPVAQRFPLDVRHGKPEPLSAPLRPCAIAPLRPSHRPAVQHRQHMRMLQPGRGPDLPLEPLRAERRREVRMEHLERDRPVVPEVAGEPDGGHAAAAQLALELVSVPQPFAQCGDRVGHDALCEGNGPGKDTQRPGAGEGGDG